MESTLVWHSPDTSVASHARSLHSTLPDLQAEHTQACMDAAQLSTTIKSSQGTMDRQHDYTCTLSMSRYNSQMHNTVF